MHRFPMKTLLAACIATAATSACAQPLPADAPMQSAPSSARPLASTLRPIVDPQRMRIDAAISAAERGQFNAGANTDLATHPLYGWVEFADAKHRIDSIDSGRMQALLARHDGTAVGTSLRSLWLAALSRRQDWAAFESAWRAGIDDTTLRCAHLAARQALGRTDARWTLDGVTVFTNVDEALPGVCDSPMDALAAQGALTDAMRWQRIETAAANGRTGIMRTAARGLPAADAALADDYARYIDAPHQRATGWPKTARSRLIASHGLARAAKTAPDAIEAQLPGVSDALQFSVEDRGRVQYAIALWTVASYGPQSSRRLAAVPAASYDERLHEWRVREAMARSDWPAALTAIRAMGAKQRSDSRWTYFEARLAEKAGDRGGAQRLYREAAKKPEFHGFLAADRLDTAYALCPLQPRDADAARNAVARDPALIRAFGLYALKRKGWAQREWDEALSRFDDTQRRIAVEAAQANGWYDRAVFNLGKTPDGTARPDELRYYHLRFPLHHDADIRRAAVANDLDPAWIAAEIRAESVFDPNARSSANAQGLMQVIPTTGMSTARALGLPWPGADALYEPSFNIVIGSAHLRELLDKYGGQPYEAMAGYNAGPAPLQRWKSQRAGMDPDFWIETISYKETRDYVARVLAFSVLYDWRLNGSSLRVSDRMHARLNGERVPFECKTP